MIPDSAFKLSCDSADWCHDSTAGCKDVQCLIWKAAGVSGIL